MGRICSGDVAETTLGKPNNAEEETKQLQLYKERDLVLFWEQYNKFIEHKWNVCGHLLGPDNKHMSGGLLWELTVIEKNEGVYTVCLRKRKYIRSVNLM